MTIDFREPQRQRWRRRTWGWAAATIAFDGLSVGTAATADIHRCGTYTTIGETLWPLGILATIPAIATTVCVLQLTRLGTYRRPHLIAAASPLAAVAVTFLVAWTIMQHRSGLPCLD